MNSQYLILEKNYLIIIDRYNKFNEKYLTFYDCYKNHIILIEKILDNFNNITKNYKNKYGRQLGKVKKQQNFTKKLEYMKTNLNNILPNYF
jgi:hypothetical protein|uniref:Uncharacterized protein n=1 Tax=viral metagenome TaxID=1070528 RepID=A0A6C0JNX6_9ZZZZ